MNSWITSLKCVSFSHSELPRRHHAVIPKQYETFFFSIQWFPENVLKKYLDLLTSRIQASFIYSTWFQNVPFSLFIHRLGLFIGQQQIKTNLKVFSLFLAIKKHLYLISIFVGLRGIMVQKPLGFWGGLCKNVKWWTLPLYSLPFQVLNSTVYVKETHILLHRYGFQELTTIQISFKLFSLKYKHAHNSIFRIFWVNKAGFWLLMSKFRKFCFQRNIPGI